MKDKIIGKVAEIIDNRTLALNIGQNLGVRVGMVFQIFDKTGKIIKDPDNNQDLGIIQIPKIKVRISYVSDKYCLAETYKFKEVNEGGSYNLGVSGVFAPPKFTKKYETFDMEREVRQAVDQAKSIIKIGDIAELVNGLDSKSANG